MTTGFNLARIIGLLTLAVVLSGCSAIKLGYNNLPELAYWWLDGYVDFEDGQALRAREDLQRLHRWHREAELPRYGQLLQRVEQLAAADMTAAQACALVPDLRERLHLLAERAEPAMVTMALGLSAAQLQHLERKYGKNNTEYRKEWLQLSLAKQVDKRTRLLVERADMVYGSLSDEQHAALRHQIERSGFDAERVLKERQRRQQDTLQTLRKLAGQPVPFDQARGLMRSLLSRNMESPDEAYRAYEATFIQDSCRIIAATHNGTTPSQREHAVRRLRAYQRDLQELAAAK